MGKIRLLIFAILILAPLSSVGQPDSLYIVPAGYDVSVRAFVEYKYLLMEYNDGRKLEREFKPNAPMTLGVGFSLYNTVINLNVGYGVRLMDKDKYGKTRAFDLQVHNFQRKFVFDVYLQRYKGFYEETRGSITLHPDMKVRRYSIHGQYIFNHRKFSYKAAFEQNERQVMSAGSWLLGVEGYRTRISSEEPLTSEGGSRTSNYMGGVNGGYAYTWALGRHWNISGVLAIGLTLGNGAFDKHSIMVYPVFSPRVSFGYDRGNWAAGVSYIGNMMLFTTEDKGELGIHAGRARFSVSRRFNRRK